MSEEEDTEINDRTYEEEPEILKTRQLLPEAEALLKDIEEMLDRFTENNLSTHRQHAVVGPVDRDTLVIDGLRFLDAASKEELKRLSSQSGVE